MAVSNVSIANRALQKLGAKRISSLDQDHPNARSMNAAFTRVRDRELGRYDWSFAIKRASIAADGDGPTWGDWNRYSLPNDYISLMRDDETGIAVDWKVEGLYILSMDSSPLQFRYIARIDDPNTFNVLFVEVLASALALDCCKEIADSAADKQLLQVEYDKDVATAKQRGAIEKGAQDFPEDSWIAARR
jgi:hypothetical protein